MTIKNKCYHCGLKLEEEDVVEKKIPLKTKNGIRMYRRKFHIECIPDLEMEIKTEKVTQSEERDWDDCYEKFREVLGYNTELALNNYAVMRLRGLRVGKYMPNGENVKNIKRGYPYKVIYRAILWKAADIRQSLAKANIKDNQHRINYAMTIIIKEIDYVYMKFKAQERSNKMLDKLQDDLNIESEKAYEEVEWVNKGSITSENRVELLRKQEEEELKKDQDDVNWDEIF